MRRTRARRLWWLPALLAAAACSASPTIESESGATGPPPSLVTLPEVVVPAPTSLEPVAGTAPAGSADAASSLAPAFVLADADGRVGVVGGDGRLAAVRDDAWRSTLSLDGRYVVSTVVVATGDTKVAWDVVPSADVLGGTVLAGGEFDLAATQVGGHLAALVNPASAPGDGTIAGGRSSTTIVLAAPDVGEVARYELAGNVVPEAFGSTQRPDGIPAQMFMLEYLPAEAPLRYRVRVLDTMTGALSLPLNLRFKGGPPVDQEMAGITRGQVLAGDHGLLFTLYRGTNDMPHGHPSAFVHTLDLYDGVWCLDVPDEMELEQVPGALATYGDRLYVASANGTVGAYSIADLVSGPIEMLWVARLVDGGGTEAPAIAAGPDGAVVTWPWMSGFHHVGPDGAIGPSTIGPAGTQAIALTAEGDRVAVGDTWWDLPTDRPHILARVTRLLVAPDQRS